jgi:putative ABC transport system ATP-binding protein
MAAESQGNVAEVEGIVKRYRRGDETVTALDGISLAIRERELVALVGPSGCGKSTCLNILAGVDTADEGRVSVCGERLDGASEEAFVRHRRSRVGVVFQAFHLMPHLTAEENVALPLALAGRKDLGRVRDLLDRVGLRKRRTHYPSELSGGEQQRVAVARALVHRPSLLLADEPTGNLDSHSGEAVLALLDELRSREGTALLLATHDPDVARRADRIVHLVDGRVVGEGLP